MILQWTRILFRIIKMRPCLNFLKLVETILMILLSTLLYIPSMISTMVLTLQVLQLLPMIRFLAHRFQLIAQRMIIYMAIHCILMMREVFHSVILVFLMLTIVMTIIWIQMMTELLHSVILKIQILPIVFILIQTQNMLKLLQWVSVAIIWIRTIVSPIFRT